MSEDKFVREFLSQVPKFYLLSESKRSKRLFAIREFNSSFGIADIVIGVYKPRIKIRKDDQLNPNWIFSLENFKLGEEFTIEEFLRNSELSPETKVQICRYFCKKGYLKKIKSNTYKKINIYKDVIESCVAIEAKLNDWKRALKQAYRYKSFSEKSYVLLPTSKSKKAIENIDQFHRYNIGLATFGEGKVELVFNPQREKIANRPINYKLNEMVKSKLLK